MKLTAIVAAVIPLLAAAVPRTIQDGGHLGDDSLPSTHSQQAGWAEAPGAGGQGAHPSPAGMDHSPHSDDIMGGNATQLHDGYPSRHLDQRDLERRAVMDHYIEECSNDGCDHTLKTCVRNLVIPKGKTNGGCVPRMQKSAEQGTMHLEDTPVMCKYYEEPNCKGRMSGPYQNFQCEYTMGSWYYGQMVWNPQSMYCEIVGFEGPWPVRPPNPDPDPGKYAGYDCTVASWIKAARNIAVDWHKCDGLTP